MSGHATSAAAIVLAASIFLVCPASAAAGPPPRPVIIIPGIMGSVLELQDTHRQIWGSYFRMSFSSPHRGLVDPTHDGLELPTTSEDLRENRDALVPTGLLERMTIVPRIMAVRVYAAWVKRLTEAGYGTGDIDHPAKGDTCFVFFYDWRRDLAETAQHLAERIDAIRAAYGDPNLKVDLIAQGSGSVQRRVVALLQADRR